MLTAETKRHIDAARQVLVGVVPNPAAQIDQITNALIYKSMDDMDQQAILQGDKPHFFVGELESYSWRRLMDSRVGNQARMNLYAEALLKFREAKKFPELFHDIFREAYLPFRSPEVLYLFLKEIDCLNYSHSEELGNAYEYLLSILSAQGDAGQFRTPRHIIDFIVNVVDPDVGDTILDPACGTGGFLISAYKHIQEKYTEIDKKTGRTKSTLTPDQRRKLMESFQGYDIDSQMAKLSRVNMYLHNFKKPKIYEYDTLTREERWKDSFSVILANPPFMSPKGGIMPNSKFGIKSSRSEVLFVQYFIDHLKQNNGRAGMIVPEGIIFQSGSAHRLIRENLIKDGLYAVVSLPAGVFNPYSGVKTSILFFDNAVVKKTKKILFVKVENDGHSLGAQRRPIDKNDLPDALNILKSWRDHILNNQQMVEGDLFNIIDRGDITKTEDLNLSADRYIKVEKREIKWPTVKLGTVATINKGRAITKKETKSGKIPVIGGGQEPAYYHNASNREGEVITVSASGAYAGFVNFFDEPIWASDCSTVQSKDSNKVLTKYIYWVLKSVQDHIYSFQRGVGQPHIYPKDLESVEIPLASLSYQKALVSELDEYQNIIDGASKVVSNWKPQIEADATWPKVKLGSLIKELEAGVSVNSDNCPARDGEKGVLKTSAVTYGTFDPRENKKILDSEIKRARVSPRANSIIISRMNTPQLVGASAYIEENWENLYLPDRLWQLIPSSADFSMRFLFYVISSENFRNLLTGISGGTSGSMKNISKSAFLELEISLPSREVQDEIVNQIEAERKHVESAKKLIEIYKKKVTEILQRVWK